MNVSCPECRSVFRVDPAKITSVAMRARCSVCGGLIAVGAAVQWGDDLPATTARAPLAAPMASTPAGVRPVLARAAVPMPRRSPAAPLGGPSATPRGVAPAPAQEPRVRPTPWTPPPAYVPGGGVPLSSVPAAPATTPPSVTPVEPAAAAPAEFVSAPIGAAPPPGPVEGRRPTPTYSTLDLEAGSEPTAVTPRRFEVMGGAAARPAAPPASQEPASSLVTPPTSASFGAPLTPPARTAIPGPGAPVPSPPVRPSEPPPVDAAAAFSARSTPAHPTAPTAGGQRRPINPFLANDPHQKARRLARALVSDMVAYHPARREEGLQQGTLKQLFRDEIKKSYEEYVEQVGREFAESTAHFQEALNDVLAGGRRLF